MIVEGDTVPGWDGVFFFAKKSLVLSDLQMEQVVFSVILNKKQ
ncbi:hypothetical protein [Clostridium sp. 1001283B150225_161107_B6]|jgi:hypothetical protein|nr:hypothetical protein [Clostridium sp. 1001283B150225_161107_B6]